VALDRTSFDKRAAAPGDVWPLAQFVQNGIVRVSQDVRGRFASEGKARPFVDDGWGQRQDGYDTIAWLRQQPWCIGKIAARGGASAAIPALLLAGTGADGIVGQAITEGPSSVYHHVWFQKGVFRAGLVEGVLDAFAWPAENLQLIQQHPRYDALWATMDLGRRPEQVRWPVLIFNRGHRIRVAISSSNYPRFEANRNNGKSWPNDQNYPSVVAHQTIFLGGTDGSSIVLPEVVGAGAQ
jgi:predicted acyl esterase